MAKYDVVVIGTGSAASAVAMPCRKAGKQVRGSNRVAAADAIQALHNQRCSNESRREFREERHCYIPRLSPLRGARSSSGWPQCSGGYKCRCSCGFPARGFEDAGRADHAVTSEQFLELECLPERILFIGGGYISFEFAHVAARAGAEWDQRHGVKVNEYLQSVSNPAVYAAGDAAASPGPPLTPVANYEGKIVAENLLQGNHRKPNYEGIPSVVFTVPPFPSMGMQEKAARQLGLKTRVNTGDTAGWYSSCRVAERFSGFKVLVEETSGRLLCAHLLGPDAGETINIFALAIRKGLTSADLKDMLFAYPTLGSEVVYMV